ncbi:MAG: phosphotransferase, partial [Myxococcota bacterium]|nr:phosphotransferase [Myxococcota bacterium]
TTIAPATPRPVDVEQSNTSVVYGDACILKIVRKIEEGTSPDLEMGEFLTRAGYTHTPRLLAAIELARRSGEPATVGMMHEFVANDGDAWAFTLIKIGQAAKSLKPVDTTFVRRLAQRIAELHGALSSPTQDARFAPEPIERQEREALGGAVERSLEALWGYVDDHALTLPRDAVDRLQKLRARAGDYRRCIAGFVEPEHGFTKTRVHGDLHLGQVLVRKDDFMLIDFEGEPARSLAERKAKRSPFADVAGMLRSLHYASVTAAREGPPSDRAQWSEFAEAWHRQARREFLQAYLDAALASSSLPRAPEARHLLLRFYLLEKCVYELHYEINNRPDWVIIPALGLEQILEDEDAA